jgi:hypothetical protein
MGKPFASVHQNEKILGKQVQTKEEEKNEKKLPLVSR